MVRLTRKQRRYLLFLVCLALTRWLLIALNEHLTVTPPRDSLEALLENAPPISVFESLVVGETADLQGRLIVVEQRAHPHYRIAELAFATGDIRTLFAIPSGALVYQVAAGGHRNTLLLTYSAPTAEGQALYDRNGIYEFDETTGALTRLLGEDIPNVYYAYPQRSANTLYYAIYERGVEAQRIEAYDLNTRTVRRIAENATRPVFALFMARQTAIHAQDDTALAEAKRIATEAGWGKTVTLEFDDKTGTMFVKSKGLPDHEILPAYQALSIIDNKTTYVITAQEQYMKVIIPLSQKEWVIDGIPFLDACNGHPNPLAVQYHYHYHTTEAPPYIVSCYAGEIDLGESPLELFTRGVDLSYPPPPVPPGALLPPRPALPQPQTTPTAGK